MEERIFHLRSRSDHAGDANDLVALSFELEVDGEWQPVTLSMKTRDWNVYEITAHFRADRAERQSTAEDLAFIGERMRDCPISRNLTTAVKTTTLEVVA